MSDVVEKLRADALCLMCNGIAEEAASEIERLRGYLADQGMLGSHSSDDVMRSLAAAVADCDPCGRQDCVSADPHFLAVVLAEMTRLRRTVAAGAALAIAARRAWRASGVRSQRVEDVMTAAARFEAEIA
jgi:hypothetical protein